MISLLRSVHHLSLLSALAVPTLLTGCDVVTSGDYPGEELAEIHGAITGTPSAAPSAPSAAVVWFTPTNDGLGGLLGEGVEVDSTFPSSFSFSLYSPPPASTILQPDDANGMAFAIGSILAFDDKNNDGTLSVTSDNIGLESPDEIIGVAEQDFLLYIETRPNAPLDGIPNAQDIEPGYYIMHFPCSDLDCVPEITVDSTTVQISLTAPTTEFPENFPFLGGDSNGNEDGESGGGSE